MQAEGRRTWWTRARWCSGAAGIAPLAFAIALVTGWAISGCGAERKHQVLSFFFDGVPDPNGEPAPDKIRREPAPDKPVAARVVIEPGSRHPKQPCGGCHAVDGAFALLGKPTELCDKSCHRPDQVMFQAPHDLACVTCHSPHSSPLPNLLRETDQALCATCHDEEGFPWLALHRENRGADCQRCHTIHSADNPDLRRPEEAAETDGGVPP